MTRTPDPTATATMTIRMTVRLPGLPDQQMVAGPIQVNLRAEWTPGTARTAPRRTT